MKTAILLSFILCNVAGAFASDPASASSTPAVTLPNGILHSIENGVLKTDGGHVVVTRDSRDKPIVIHFSAGPGIGLQNENHQWWVLPIGTNGEQVAANRAFWTLPSDAKSKDHAWNIQITEGDLTAQESDKDLTVTINAPNATLASSEARPHSDVFGHRYSLEFTGGAELGDALAALYWGTILPSVVEKTLAAHFPYHDGYVLSTLNVKSYAGSYPAVDHEFQIKGRLAFGSELDRDVVRRMIALQFKLINDDPEGLYRMPTSVQPDGRREYHVRRNSQNNHQNAAMFPLTGDIEVIEECWRYYESTKDKGWLQANIENLEHAAGWVLAAKDQYGRIWSDVYYEDQVMKDGRETEAQAFAARAFEILAAMEEVLDRNADAIKYQAVAKELAAALVAPLPRGYWDAKNARFIDWVDRDSKVHDHIPLLANELPVTLNFADTAQAAQVRSLIAANHDEFERFPSFVAAKIADYDRSEIGDGGPYDLCAAGRYWYWDAAFMQSERQNGALLDQLNAVAAEAAKNNYWMDERYDMDHVYYVDGKNSHGAQKYYEYPNVFTAVLIERLLGLTIPADADVSVEPHLNSYGSVEFDIPAYAVRYTFSEKEFVLKNLSPNSRRFKVNLSGLGATAKHYRLTGHEADTEKSQFTLTLGPRQEARWAPIP